MLRSIGSRALKPRQYPLLVAVVRTPESMRELTATNWDLLVRQARRANFLASLHALVTSSKLLDRVPERAMRHLDWSRTIADKQRSAVAWEVRQIRTALAPTGIPVILLKGAAYLSAKLPVSAGRVFGDIDIIVPKSRLQEVEAALMIEGWAGMGHDEYDQHYYRQWMHEIPPMRHVKRGAVIDVHHAILPLSSRLHPASRKLLSAAIALPDMVDVRVLCPIDMLLHSAVHLFYEGELENGFRDLVDLHHLIGDFGIDPAFWVGLLPRARELDLQRPLFYSLRYCSTILGTQIPKQTIADVQADAPAMFVIAIMDQLYRRALLPAHDSCNDWFSKTARFLLYIRGNWLRMPPLLLARHLLRKSFASKKTSYAP